MIDFDTRYAWAFAQALADGEEDKALQTAFALTSIPGAVELADHEFEIPGETAEELADAVTSRLRQFTTAPADVVWGILIPEILGIALAYLEDFNTDDSDESHDEGEPA